MNKSIDELIKEYKYFFLNKNLFKIRSKDESDIYLLKLSHPVDLSYTTRYIPIREFCTLLSIQRITKPTELDKLLYNISEEN